MSELIPITTACVGGHEIDAVDARTLYTFLGVKSNFRDWIRNRIEDFGFVENQDFVGFAKNLAKPNGGRPTAEYALSLNMAKELSMVERTEKGKQARLYFIDCERRAKEAAASPKIPQTLSEALRLAADLEDKRKALEAKIEVDAPKVAFCDRIDAASGEMTFTQYAKLVGVKRSALLDWLRANRFIYGPSNSPYQERIRQGVLLLRNPVGRTHSDGSPVFAPYAHVTPKGAMVIFEHLRNAGLVAEHKRQAVQMALL